MPALRHANNKLTPTAYPFFYKNLTYSRLFTHIIHIKNFIEKEANICAGNLLKEDFKAHRLVGEMGFGPAQVVADCPCLERRSLQDELVPLAIL
jgi:hypothetical protein